MPREVTQAPARAPDQEYVNSGTFTITSDDTTWRVDWPARRPLTNGTVASAVETLSAEVPAIATYRLAEYNSGASPASRYLARLSPASRRVQGIALNDLAYALDCYDGAEYCKWHQLTAEQVLAIREYCIRKFATSTARRMMSALRGVIREAWRMDLLSVEERDRLLDLPPIRGSEPPAGRQLSLAEIRWLFNNARTVDGSSADRQVVLSLLVFGGLRRAEVASLTAADVEVYNNVQDGLQAGSLFSSPSPSINRGERERRMSDDPGSRAEMHDSTVIRVRVRGKGNTVRFVYLAGRPAEIVLAQAQSRSGKQALTRYSTGQSVYRVLRRLGARAALRRFTPHDLRRTYASMALGRGVDLATVQRSMGHADPRTTARYDRRGDDTLATAAISISEYGTSISYPTAGVDSSTDPRLTTPDPSGILSTEDAAQELVEDRRWPALDERMREAQRRAIDEECRRVFQEPARNRRRRTA